MGIGSPSQSAKPTAGFVSTLNVKHVRAVTAITVAIKYAASYLKAFENLGVLSIAVGDCYLLW